MIDTHYHAYNITFSTVVHVKTGTLQIISVNNFLTEVLLQKLNIYLYTYDNLFILNLQYFINSHSKMETK